MILGILSDTHGRVQLASYAVEVLKAAGAEAFVHCGDVGSDAVLDVLAGTRAWFVWGNSDDPGPFMERHARTLGLKLPAEVPLRLELAGKSLAVFHGHESEFARLVHLADVGEYEQLAEQVAADYLLFGHSHVPFDEHFSTVRAINPGAVHRAHPPSVATLELETDRLRYWQLDGGQHASPRLVEWRRTRAD